jgi:hypothetical protein
MPRTAAKGGRRKDNRDPLVIYNDLPHYKQVICWYYFRFVETNGEEGWNISEAGSVFHFRSSKVVQAAKPPEATNSWFRHIAKSMATLADKIAQRKERLPKPVGIPGNLATPAPQPPFVPDLRTPSQPDPRPFPSMQSPPSTPGNNIPPMSVPDSSEGALTCPTASGYFKKFDYTNRVSYATIMTRVLVHGAVQASMVDFEWINKRLLKYRCAWPEFFQYPEQMASFCRDADGNIIYGTEHPLTMDFAERIASMTEEDGKIYNSGFFQYDQDMNTDNVDELVFEVLTFKIPSQDTTVRMLQVEAR